MKREQRKALQAKQEAHAAAVEDKVIAYLKKSSAHRRPTTRRDFLRIGAINTLAYVAAPSLISVLAKMGVAEAAECVAGAPANMASYFTVNHAGGWSLAGNWVPFTKEGAPLTKYRSLGVATETLPTDIVTAFANRARFYSTSNMAGWLAGVKSIPGAEAAMAKAVFVGVPAFSMDDSDVNRMDPCGLVAKAGLAGTVLPPAISGRQTRTGVGHYAAMGMNPPPPLRIVNLNSIFNAVSFNGTALATFNASQQESLMKTIKNLSDRQVASISNLSGGQEFKDLVECATGRNIQNVKNNLNAALDYRNDSGMVSIWGTANESQPSVVYSVLKGFSGAGAIEMGGYDYHNNLDAGNNAKTFQTIRNDQNLKNFQAGQLIGKMLASANLLGKKTFISLLSDGSVSSGGSNTINGVVVPNDARAFTGDSGERGCLAFIAFNPTGAPSVDGQQIGGFTTNGIVDRTYTTGADAENAGLAIFANWAKFSGNMSLYEKALPGNTRFTPAILNDVVKL